MAISISKYSDNALQSLMKTQTVRLSEDLATSQKKLATGEGYDSFATSGTKTGQFMNLQSNSDVADGNAKTATEVSLEQSRMSAIMTEIQDIAKNLHTRYVQAVNAGSENSATFNKSCQSDLDNLGRLLNTAGSSTSKLFGGFKTDGDVVDFSALPIPAIGATLDPASYYRGSADKKHVTLGDNNTLQYGITADNTHISNLVHALKVGAVTDPANETNRPRLAEQLNRLKSTTTGLADLVGEIGKNTSISDSTAKSQESAKEAYTEQAIALGETNVVEEFQNFSKLELALKITTSINMKLHELDTDVIETARRA
ncbi:MAG: hypothetical protein ACPGXY_05430 [Alphaproteobacteria bacterium]